MSDLEEVGAEIVRDWPPLTDEQLSKIDLVVNGPSESEEAA